MSWKKEADEIQQRYTRAEALGGDESVARHHGQGRLTVRERIGALLDAGSFQEVGKLTGSATYGADGALTNVVPAPYVMGLGKLDGRPIAIGGGTSPSAAARAGAASAVKAARADSSKTSLSTIASRS